MARYVMANRRAGKFQDDQKRSSRAALESGFNDMFAASADMVTDLAPADELARRVVVFDADPEEVAAKAATLPADVIVEPEILHFREAPTARRLKKTPAGAKRRAQPARARATRAALQEADAHLTAPVGLEEDTVVAPAAADVFSITVRGSGAPLRGAEVSVFIRGPILVRDPLRTETNASGVATVTIPDGFEPANAAVSPAGNHWSMIVRNPTSGMVVDCPPIESTGALDWWHAQMGITALDLAAGGGIRVGVIDSGVGPHPCLSHVLSQGAFINNRHDPAGGADVDSHGTHVSGLIGARPIQAIDRAGIAPGVTLMTARVFPSADAGANQGDIVNAIDHLSRDMRADLLNMSLGASRPSQIERDAIIDAAERGTLCICAAGNSAGAVQWPGAFPEAIAASALGLRGTAPTGSVSAQRVPTDPARHGNAGLFLANFSCFGTEVDTTAPGVATISTVPARFGMARPYAVMDGTSMASPIACGALAVVLSRSARYLGLTGSARTDEARAQLRDHSVSVGLQPTFQGRGILRIP